MKPQLFCSFCCTHNSLPLQNNAHSIPNYTMIINKSRAPVTPLNNAAASELNFTQELNAFNFNDVNGPAFWKAWTKAGGDPDEYVKETLPTYGVIGALLLTVSIPMTLSPISFAFGNPADDVTNESIFVQLYSIFLNLSTGLSLSMIILSMGVYQQYVNAYSKDLRVAFAAKFGYVVAVFTNFLVGDIVSLLAAIFIGVIKTYSTISAIIGIVCVGLPSILAAILYIYMSLWNSNNYAKQMVIDIKAQLEEEAKQKKDAEQVSKIGDVEMQKLIDSSKEMQKLFGNFAASFEVILKQQQSAPSRDMV